MQMNKLLILGIAALMLTSMAIKVQADDNGWTGNLPPEKYGSPPPVNYGLTALIVLAGIGLFLLSVVIKIKITGD